MIYLCQKLVVVGNG